jgi:putative GTP pyrophosphokinase
VRGKSFPGGSKSRVNAAGAAVREGRATADDRAVIEEWRAAHSSVINTFQALLRNRAKEYGARVIQRHKRKATIFDKLLRQPGMDLARMDDVAGCRVICPDVKTLYEFRDAMHRARFDHVLKTGDDKYDYIKVPKPDGYRGIHDAYEYNVGSEEGQHLRGLRIELQYRTEVQNAWATTNEIIAHITKGASEPKYHRGDSRYLDLMALASEVLARSFEACPGPRQDLDNAEVVELYERLENELNLRLKLASLGVALKGDSRNPGPEFILFREGAQLELFGFGTQDEALEKLFELENTRPGADVVYVPRSTADEIRSAYKNYYDDAHDFLSWTGEGVEYLRSLR